MRNALAELLVVFPAAHICIAGCGFDKCARTMLLVSDPIAIVRVTILKCVESMPVALAESESTVIGSTRMVDADPMAVTVSVCDISHVVLRGEVVVCEVTIELVGEIAGEGAESEIRLGICKSGAGCEGTTLLVGLGQSDDDNTAVVEIDLGEVAAVLDGSRGGKLFFFPYLHLLLVFRRKTEECHYCVVYSSRLERNMRASRFQDLLVWVPELQKKVYLVWRRLRGKRTRWWRRL
jgi:hypothetical protein